MITLAFVGMRFGWNGKAKKFAQLVEPQRSKPQDAIVVCGPFEARFAGTTSRGNWLDRVTVHGLGTPRGVDVSLYQQGIWLTNGEDYALWIPASEVSSITTSRGLAGDVVERDGMIIIEWALAQTAPAQSTMALDSGIRISRHDDHTDFLTHSAQVLPNAQPLAANFTEEQA